MRLQGKAAIVTGGGSGFGEGIVRKFVAEGARVIVADRDAAAARRVADATGALALTVDVARADDARRMVDAAFEYKEEFYILDSLNEMKLYNSARNLDIAVWKLGHDRNPAGEPYLLANELDPANRNLSFEREFGRVMGLLDFMAKIVADRNGRTFSRLTHSVVSTVFLPVSFLK